ncbi:MAG: heavy-metal-associated domain-containing protein, partial [Oscillospiraceae bacterium]|nr:heavy-metal-associated domain-containing protein [Oscillospiraceae bacterium]
MENEILLHVHGMKGRKCEDKITKEISKMPGIEMIQVNAKMGTVSVTG